MGDDMVYNNNLNKQLAATIRNIQWSYAIFWSPCHDSRVLQWGDGCYNGGIKTRKTIQTTEVKANDQTISQRSEQLRELYESLLSDNNNNHQSRRPLAALSPEDLTDVEWFYLVCMSFVFNIGQGLPGKSLASGQTIWLSNAHCVNTGVFSRSLLAKSAGVKTVVCFPFLNGVLELGVTDLVDEDLNLIQRVKASLMATSTDLAPLVQAENVELLSPSGGSSNGGAELIQPISEVFLFEGLNGVMMEDDQLSNCVNTSMASNECISQTIMNPENLSHAPKMEVAYDTYLEYKDRVQNCEDLHYQSVLSSLFKESDQGFVQQSIEKLDKNSGFRSWKKDGNKNVRLREGTSQSMLKKILFEVPVMHKAHLLLESKKLGVRKDDLCKQEALNTNHVMAERRRREKVNERFSTLRSLIPSISKADKVSILDDTIAYLKELERKVEELESCREMASFDTKKKRKTIDIIEERTSDNGDDIDLVTNKNKRKGNEIKEGEQECDQLSTRDNLVDNTITVSMVDNETLIIISCPWKENLLLNIIDAMSNLHLDSQSVHSSTIDGILSLKIESKVNGSNCVSVGSITQALLRVIRNS